MTREKITHSTQLYRFYMDRNYKFMMDFFFAMVIYRIIVYMFVCWTGLAYKMIYTNQHDIGKPFELWGYDSYRRDSKMVINSSFFFCSVCLWRTRSIHFPEQRFGCTSIELHLFFLCFVEILGFDFVWISNELYITREMHWNSTFSSIKLWNASRHWKIQNSSFSTLLVSYLHFTIYPCICMCV